MNCLRCGSVDGVLDNGTNRCNNCRFCWCVGDGLVYIWDREWHDKKPAIRVIRGMGCLYVASSEEMRRIVGLIAARIKGNMYGFHLCVVWIRRKG